MYSTNAPPVVGNINRLQVCASLSTGTICTSVCTSVRVCSEYRESGHGK